MNMDESQDTSVEQTSTSRGGGESEVEGMESSKVINKNAFHVSSNQIQSIPTSQQADELKELGLDVFNQDEFEQGVMAQVDQALASQEQERLQRILDKEVKTVEDEIRNTKLDLVNIEKVLTSVSSKYGVNSRETERRLIPVKTQRENKLKQLKKLEAKKRSLTVKLKGKDIASEDGMKGNDLSFTVEQALGIESMTKETEEELMIRTGEMTPFGTVMKFKQTSDGNSVNKAKAGTSQLSEFEKYLMDQEKRKTDKKRLGTKNTDKTKTYTDKGKSKSKPPKEYREYNGKKWVTKFVNQTEDSQSSNTSQESTKSSQRQTPNESPDAGGSPVSRQDGENFFDRRSKTRGWKSESDFSNFSSKRTRYPKPSHNFDSDIELSDFENGDGDYDICGSSGDEYIPDAADLKHSFIDSEEDEDGEGNEDEIDDIAEGKPSNVGQKRKRQTAFKKVKRPKYRKSEEESDEDDIGNIKQRFKRASKAYRTRKEADDGTMASYERRLKKWRKSKLLKKKEKIDNNDEESSDASDAEFDGGLSVPGKIWTKLYRYQKTGVKWLWELHCQDAGGIVGDEMGLGKTIQTIAFLAALKTSKLRERSSGFVGLGPVIIVCPATVMQQWVKEFHTWWPPFRVAVLHSSGSYTTSEAALVKDVVQSNGVLITSFSTLVIQQEAILKHRWHYIILDEGHKIRNPDAQVTLACKQFRTPHRIILSGSPMQNNLKELWSLFDFVFPGKLGTLPDFMQHFSVPLTQGGYANATQVQVQTAYKCACVLRDTIHPYLLRRMKADVKLSLDLPDKNEQVLFCRLTDDQREVYKEYLDSKECQLILRNKFMVFPGLITLRKICNHPDLSTGGPKIFHSDILDKGDETMNYGYWKRSGKMIVIESLLRLWKKQSHRVLLFTQSTQMLDVLEWFVQEQKYTYLRIDGTTSIASRQPLINQYNQDSSIFVFLLTTRVGGLGVNLTGADRVVIYDPDWNPSTDTQARERAWRIGQQKQVTIYRLLTTGTIEEKIYHRQIFKQFLTNRVLKDPKQRRFFKSNDLFELFTLGQPDNVHGTETQAIFAGTKSEVKVTPTKQERGENRFDKIKARKESKIKKNTEQFDEAKITRMRELAKKLSKQIASSVLTDSASESTLHSKPTSQTSPSTTAVASNTEAQPPVRSQSNTSEVATNHEKNNRSVVEKHSQKHVLQEEQSSCKIQHEGHRKTRDIKKKRKDKSKDKKRKRKKRDATIDGERIAHLSRHSTYRSEKDEENEPVDNKHEDTYVLQKLFKKSGVHSALQHDTIMMSANPDYALVEGEAERVAKEAASALKRSRSQCLPAASGVPTWTGMHGGTTAKKPRFGQKKNSRLLTAPGKVASPAVSDLGNSPGEQVKHFDGSLSGNTQNTGDQSSSGVMSSGQLLARMKQRNHMIKMQANEEEHQPRDDNVDSGDTNEDNGSAEGAQIELITEIRNFVAFQCAIDGQATTEELLNEFKNKLPPQDSAKFKFMLKQICFFDKNNGIGIWSLKPEFR